MSPILETTFDSFGSNDYIPPAEAEAEAASAGHRQDSGASGNYRGFGRSLEQDLERAALVESSLLEQMETEVRIKVYQRAGIFLFFD